MQIPYDSERLSELNWHHMTGTYHLLSRLQTENSPQEWERLDLLQTVQQAKMKMQIFAEKCYLTSDSGWCSDNSNK